MNVGEDEEKREHFYAVGGNVNWYSHCGKEYRGLSKKLNIELLHDSAILLLGIYPKKYKNSNLKRYMYSNVYVGLPRWLSGKESAYQCRRHKRNGFDPGSGRSLGVGIGNPLQYSCLETSMDLGAWQATVHGIAESWTRLSH